MRNRILFVAGIAIGYIVGARAGRSAYDAVVERVRGVSGSPAVQQVAEKAKDTLAEKAPKVAEVAKQATETATAAASAAKEAGDSAAASASSEPESDSESAAEPSETPKPTPPSAQAPTTSTETPKPAGTAA